ncbi:M48 family metallopeptidase [Geothrix sp. PMB-07]|uniref:M48 family metallopeptidase n=1 Tax=Geothrix sp. PMB-07 TaxID=3068640 RepID=UPI00274123EB|nr:M48 family metallopeptidase [Geothrix sp. PMB-07]WLT30474.1 M48 family metallopeptidase [Geothrix sp. PMB-07]
MKKHLRALGVCLSLGLAGVLGGAEPALPPNQMPAQMPAVLTVPKEAQAGPGFSAEAATNAYLAQIPPSALARSNAYFEGGYWLILWNFLLGVAISLLLLNRRWSSRMRQLAERITRFRFLQTLIYWGQYVLLTYALSFPLNLYEGFLREHHYGLATQTFGAWLGDEGKGLLLNVILGGLAVALLFAIVRRLQRTWWIWGAVASLAILVFSILIGPVFLQPIFNSPKKLSDPKITTPILSLVRANGIPVKDIYEIDASKQTTRMSANVSGFAGTTRITLNDNLIRRGSPEEIQAVMGHEMGHYVLNHIPKMIEFLLIVIVALFALLRWSLGWALARWGEAWGVRGVDDPAVLPLVTLVAGLFLFILTPVMNTYIRTQEHEADMYGVNASRQPDGFAQAALHLAEYRKMSPTPLEEALFYDHPSGRNRIFRVMQWKAENQALMSQPQVSQPSAGTTAANPPTPR